MVQPTRLPGEESSELSSATPAAPPVGPARPRLTFGISTLKDLAPAPAPMAPTRPAVAAPPPRPPARPTTPKPTAQGTPMALLTEAAARVAVTRRMAQAAEVTLTELRRQHPAVVAAALDPTRVGGAAAQALADPAFLTRLRLLALTAAPPAAEEAPASAALDAVVPLQAPMTPPSPSRLEAPAEREEARQPAPAADEAADDGAVERSGTAWQR